MDIRKDILWRVYISFIGVVLLSFFIFGKAFYIQRIQGHYWRSMSDSMHQSFQPLVAERGNIYSEDGQMLSVSIPTFDIYIDFTADGLREKNGKRFFENIDSFSRSMADYFGDKSAGQYKRELKNAFEDEESYYPLKKKLSFDDYKLFRDFPLARLGKNKSGIIVEVKSKRLTPFKLLANRTIGLSREYTTSDGTIKKQNVGIEKSYDSILSGHNGQRQVRYTPGGSIPVQGSETDPENGKDLYTTLDVNMQDIAETALMKALQQCQGPYGTVIVMETTTGKIKAMANLGRQNDGSYQEDDNYALRTTEPGSTIKLATLLSVLDKGSSNLQDMINVGSEGRLQVGSKMVTEAETMPKSSMTLSECFAHSSNVGMSTAAYKAFARRPQELAEYMHRFHLDIRVPVDLADLPKPVLAPLNQKGSAEGNMLWMSFGYGIQLSPLHTLMLYNSIANNGKMMKPCLVNSIRSNGSVIKQFDPVVLEENITRSSVVNDAKTAMRMVVTDGTGKPAFKDMPFAVAGKTGTAHVADGKIKYGDGVYQATFVGYFPAEKPQYTCIVVIRTKPHAAVHFGGALAAPVFREIATKLYTQFIADKNYLNLAASKDSAQYFYAGFSPDIKIVFDRMQIRYTDSSPQENWAWVYPDHLQPTIKQNKMNDASMPNVKGMGLKDAVYLLESRGIKVLINGKGKVIYQSLAPGTTIGKGITVTLELSS